MFFTGMYFQLDLILEGLIFERRRIQWYLSLAGMSPRNSFCGFRLINGLIIFVVVRNEELWQDSFGGEQRAETHPYAVHATTFSRTAVNVHRFQLIAMVNLELLTTLVATVTKAHLMVALVEVLVSGGHALVNVFFPKRSCS